MNTKYLLFFVPFFSFFSGFIIISFLTGPQTVVTPAILGIDLSNAAELLSKLNLNIRITQTKEDTDLPDNSIIQQSPQPGSLIKQNQSIFCVITKKPETAQIPNLINKTETEIKSINVHVSHYYVPNIYKTNTCIGQLPKAGSNNVPTKNIITYIATKPNTLAIFPRLIGMPICEVSDWASLQGFTVETAHQKKISPDHHCIHCTIIDQKPLPGTIINTKKPLVIQLVT